MTIQSAPEKPIIESRDGNQFLNFDLIVRNTSKLTLHLSEIQLAVYGATHSLVMAKSLNTDASLAFKLGANGGLPLCIHRIYECPVCSGDIGKVLRINSGPRDTRT